MIVINKIIENLSSQLDSYASDTESNPSVDEVNLIKSINTLKKLITLKPEEISYNLYKNQALYNFIKLHSLDERIVSSTEDVKTILTDIEDIIKIEKAKNLYSSKFKEYIKDTEKLAEGEQKARSEQVEKENIRVKRDAIQKVNTTSVTNLVQQSDSGEINLDALDELLNQSDDDSGSSEAKSKINEARSINSTYRRLTLSGGIIDEISEEDPTKQKAAKDAKILLSSSKAKANSLEEFLDVDREAFLDPRLLYDEELHAELSENTELLQEILEEELDKARALIQQAKQILEEENISLGDIPSPQEGTVVKVLKDTGHDSTSAIVPANSTTVTGEEVSKYEFVTPSVSSDVFEQQKVETETSEQQSEEDYWKPSITEFPIHREPGDDRPFHEILRASNYKYTYPVGNGIYNTSVYTKEDVDKIEKVYNYLKDKGAFSIINSGQIQPGEKVTFFTDRVLNEEVGEVVILIKDSKGRTIGNLVFENSKIKGNQALLKAFRDKFIEEYTSFTATNESSDDIFEYGESTVAKNMIGKPQYTERSNRLPLNKIFPKGFKLGIAMTSGKNANIVVSPGRKKAQGQTSFERAILSPINAVAGQPLVLIPTNRKIGKDIVHITIPFMMSPYSASTRNTKLGIEIEKVVKSFADIKTSAQAADAKFSLQELLAIPDLHININNGELTVSLSPLSDTKQTVIYKGSVSNPVMSSKIIEGLLSMEIPFQISRKYINTTFDSADYNTMIGEIAETNLPINTEGTVNAWFTINPISSGVEVKAKSPKTTGLNPNRAVSTYQEIYIGNLQFSFNSKTNEVLDSEGRPYSGKYTNHVKAKAHAIKINAEPNSVVKTDWGYYDLKTDDFVINENELQDTSGFTKERTLGVSTDLGNSTSSDKSNKTPTPSRSLTNTKEKKAVFEALNTEQQNLLMSKSPAKQRALMDTLVTAFDGTNFDENILGTTLNNFLTEARLRESNTETYQKWDKEKELKWMQRVLPNLSTSDRLRVVEGIEGLIPIGNTGKKAYGRFRNGIIEIGRNAARGTVYHEAFHAVTHTLLSEDEMTTLLEEAKSRYGNIGNVRLEEKLAEDFRRYVQIEETGFSGKVRKIFRILKHIINQLFGNEPYIDNLFYRINRGKLAEYSFNKKSKIFNERNRVNLEIEKMDADYLSAVERGDMATAQRMVMEAAKLAMPNTKVVDEDGNPKIVYHSTEQEFTIFDRNKTRSNTGRSEYKGHYFTDNKKWSEGYGGITKRVFLNIVNPYTPKEIDTTAQAIGHSSVEEITDFILSSDIWYGATETEKTNLLESNRGIFTEEFIREANKYDGIITPFRGYSEYIAEHSSQIKSADPVTYDDAGNVIPLSERFNLSNDDIRYSIIGEKGASALDMAEEATIRMDNLAIARQMEERGDSALNIRMATGWERGADGLWRYEIEENIPKDFFTKNLDVETTLGEILGDDHQYFKAYPSLADIKVLFSSQAYTDAGIYGGYNPINRSLLMFNSDENLETFVHEIQHAIQVEEGFAVGGGEENFRFEGDIGFRQGQQYIPMKLILENKTRKYVGKETAIKYGINSDFLDILDKEGLKESYEERKNEIPEMFHATLEDIINNPDIISREQAIPIIQKVIDDAIAKAKDAAHAQYKRIAGEVESRNVEHRLNMTPEERRNKLLSETEDVAREDQILMLEYGVIMSREAYTPNISWYENSIEETKRETKKIISELKKAPSINKTILFSDGRFSRYNSVGYKTYDDAYSHLNTEVSPYIRSAYFIREYKGNYYILKKSKDDISREIQAIKQAADRTISEYEKQIEIEETINMENASRQALEEQEVYYREIEQYHIDKYDIGRLSLEDKAYIKSRGISIEEYINMSFSEKDALFRCK